MWQDTTIQTMHNMILMKKRGMVNPQIHHFLSFSWVLCLYTVLIKSPHYACNLTVTVPVINHKFHKSSHFLSIPILTWPYLISAGTCPEPAYGLSSNWLVELTLWWMALNMFLITLTQFSLNALEGRFVLSIHSIHKFIMYAPNP